MSESDCYANSRSRGKPHPSSPEFLRYEDLPRSFHRWKWRVLLAFAFFYLFLYLGRFNFWPVAPLVKEELSLTHFEIGLINALLLWGFGLGDLVHGRLAEAYGLRLWMLLGRCLRWYSTGWLASAPPRCLSPFPGGLTVSSTRPVGRPGQSRLNRPQVWDSASLGSDESRKSFDLYVL